MRRVCALALAALRLLPIPASALRATSKSRYMRPAFRRRSPSSRIPPIARCSLSSSRAGAFGSCRTATVAGTDFLNLSGAISSGGERGLLGMALAPDYAEQRPVLRELHQHRRPHGRRTIPAIARSAGRGCRRPGSICAGMDRTDRPTSRSLCQPQRRLSGVRPGRIPLHRHGRRRRRQRPGQPRPESARAAGKDAARGREPARRRRDRLPGARRTIRSCRAHRLQRAPRSGRSDCGTRGASASTIPRAAAPVRWSSATSARTPGRKWTTSRPAAAAATTGGGCAKATTTTSPRRRRRISRSTARSTSTTARPVKSITGGYVYRGAALPAYRGRYFFADYVQGRVWSLGLSIDGTVRPRPTR